MALAAGVLLTGLPTGFLLISCVGLLTLGTVITVQSVRSLISHRK